MATSAATKLIRSMASHVPSRSLIGLRRLRDLPLSVLHRPHEPEFALLARFGWHEPNVVDIGANRGQSIRSLNMVLAAPRIVAVEPNPVLAAHLRQRYPEVEVHNMGMALEPGEMELHVPRYGHTWWDTRASLAPAEAAEFLDASNFARFDPRRAALESVVVPVGPLDDLDLSPQLLKVDVEGVDDLVVRGAERTIARCHPVMLIERPSEQTTGFLSGRGYRAMDYDPATARLVDPGQVAGAFNTFFLTDRHRSELGVD